MMRLLAVLALAAAMASASGPFPVIGIMSLPSDSSASGCGPDHSCEKTVASYVKFVELAGARAVRLRYNASDAEVDDMMSQVNGVLLTGGSADLSAAAKRLIGSALASAEAGGYFPVMGICLGFQFLAQAVGGEAILGDFVSLNVSLPLNFTSEAASSRLFSDAAVREIYESEPVAFNMHHFGVGVDDFAANPALRSTFRVLSTNMDFSGREYVSSMEAIDAPLYGVQFHPEKNIFEWSTDPATGQPYQVINHSEHAVFVSQSLANFFVMEARKNGNVYDLARVGFFEEYQAGIGTNLAFVSRYLFFPESEPDSIWHSFWIGALVALAIAVLLLLLCLVANALRKRRSAQARPDLGTRLTPEMSMQSEEQQAGGS